MQRDKKSVTYIDKYDIGVVQNLEMLLDQCFYCNFKNYIFVFVNVCMCVYT